MDNSSIDQTIRSLVQGNNGETVIDVLLVCAGKPVNYAGLNNFAFEELWKMAKSFAAARSHIHQEIDTAIQAVQEAIMYEKLPELIAFDGIEVLQEGLMLAKLYYAREECFQDTLYEHGKDRIWQSIYDTLGFPVEKARQRECQIAKIYLQYLNDILFHNQSTAGIAIDVDKFKHYYDSIYGKEMPPTITRDLVIEVLQTARLGFEYDGQFYPFWYIVRKDVGPEFRRKLSECIAARIA